MNSMVASASVSASTNEVAEWLLATLGIAFGVALLALAIIRTARSRRRGSIETVTAVVVVWGLLTAGSISYVLMRRMDWNADLQARIMSGYYDPSDNTNQPKLPITLWTVLGVSYAALIGWAATGSAGERSNDSNDRAGPPPPTS
jgi:hypothetical protein